jgi:hypothetical protein
MDLNLDDLPDEIKAKLFQAILSLPEGRSDSRIDLAQVFSYLLWDGGKNSISWQQALIFCKKVMGDKCLYTSCNGRGSWFLYRNSPAEKTSFDFYCNNCKCQFRL